MPHLFLSNALEKVIKDKMEETNLKNVHEQSLHGQNKENKQKKCP